MRLLRLIFFLLLLYNFPLSVHSLESQVLFLWQKSSVNTWESYGDERFQKKYTGIILNGIPSGNGILSFPDGKSVTGEWKDGKEWNTNQLNSNGKLIERYVKGEHIKSVKDKIEVTLYLRKLDGKWIWDDDGDALKDYKYEGSVSNGKPNGFGTYNSPSGNQYDGNFKNGKKHGIGTFKYTSGSIYKGDFKDGKKHGMGTFTSPSGNKYLGQWEKGKKNGKGSFLYTSGSMYQGEFKNDKQHGFGTFTWSNGAKRIGNFKKGKLWNIKELNKKGTLIKKWVNGVMIFDKKKEKIIFLHNNNGKWVWIEKRNKKLDGKYVGSINKNGIPNGSGTLSIPDGYKYEGEWKDGERNGRGTYTYRDGNVYIGDFESGQKHGNGLLKFLNGNKYEGEWKKETRHGRGIYSWANGEKYVGEFKNGKFNGKGTYTFPIGGELEGHKYEGVWQEDKKSGKGIYFFPDGSKLEGEFKEDRPWNVIDFDKIGNIKGRYVNGIRK